MKILIIEDNKTISENTAEFLRMHFFHVTQIYDGEAWFQEAMNNTYDLIILDRMLPKLDGLSIARMLKTRNITVPILFLSAKDTIFDKLEGLEIWADDYMTKPFDLNELILRIRNILARATTKVLPNHVIIIDDVTFNLQSYTVSKDAFPVPMSPKEYAIIEYLLRNRWSICTKSELYDAIWKYYWDDFLIFSNTLNVHMTRIRKKLGNKLIRTIKEAWYIID